MGRRNRNTAPKSAGQEETRQSKTSVGIVQRSSSPTRANKNLTARRHAGTNITKKDFVDRIVISGKEARLYKVTSSEVLPGIKGGDLLSLPGIDIDVPVVMQQSANYKQITSNHLLTFRIYVSRSRMAGRFVVHAILKQQHLLTVQRN